MSAVRSAESNLLLGEHLGWTPRQVNELPDATAAWLLDLIAAS